MRFFRKARDYYDILEINRNATESDIKTAFYVKSKKFHPDNYSNGSTTAFVELKNAYDTLRRPADRRFRWTHFWQEKPRFEDKKKLKEQWVIKWKWMTIGWIIVVIYIFGYIFQTRCCEHRLSNLVDEDEIARSFLRQSEFKDKHVDSLELESLARILKADVDKAWRKKRADIMKRNPEEIQEEYRWLRAVQDAGYSRRVKASLTEQRRKY
uniref:J domain-containing protein n=1 Tax=Heterorhabditis bacteriophora TaxID=37862 RepID=A0A1I7XQJ1_HETBA